MDESTSNYNELAQQYAQPLIDMANLNNSWSAEQAQKQMDFQREMSNTAHQREIADLKAAGLNPVLSAKLGGASTPAGAKAEADSSLVSAMAGILDKVMDIAINNAQAVADVEENDTGYVNYAGLFGDGSSKTVNDKFDGSRGSFNQRAPGLYGGMKNFVGDSTITDTDIAGTIFGKGATAKELTSKSNFANGMFGNPAQHPGGENTLSYKAGQIAGKVLGTIDEKVGNVGDALGKLTGYDIYIGKDDYTKKFGLENKHPDKKGSGGTF